MRLLFLTYHFPTPEQSGAGRPWSTACLIRDLGHEPVVITAGTHYLTGEDIRSHRSGLSSDENVGGFHVIKTWAPSDYRRSIARRLMNYIAFAAGTVLAGLRQRKVDAILVATDPIFILPVAYLLSLLKRAPLMLDERDVYPDTAVALGVLNSPAIIRVLDWGHKFMCWKAPSIVAATPGIKRILLNKNVNAAKIFVLPNARSCAPLAEAGEIREEIRLRHGWGSRFVALYAGNFGQANDILTILKSAELLRDSSGIHFVFIGAGEKKTQYLEFCRAQKLNNVEFLDAMPWMELQGYLAAADLAVHAFPDIAFWDCALPSKLFDYMWAAKPILFSGRGDTADLIAASGAGEVTRPGDPMAFSCRVSRLSESPEATREMGAKGYRYMAEHFSAEQLVEIMRVAIAALQLGRA